MLEQAATMFDDMVGMLNRIKKKVYRERMEYFRSKNAQILSEMVSFVEQAEKRDEVEEWRQAEKRDEVEERRQAEKVDEVEERRQAEKVDEVEERRQAEKADEVEERRQAEKRYEAAAQAAQAFADAVETRFAKRKKISGRTQMDINLFMIYYVFPAILLTQSECAVPLADAIRDEWRVRFRDSSQLDYTTYEEISNTFQEKILGLF